MRHRGLSIQTRWTLRYGATLLVCIVVFAIYAFARIERRMEQDATLLLELQAAQLTSDPSFAGDDDAALASALAARVKASERSLHVGAAVFAPDGRLRAAAGSLAGRPVAIPPALLQGDDPQVFERRDLGRDYAWRVVTQREAGGIVQVAIYGRRFERNVLYVGRIFLFALPAVLVVTALAGFWLARGSLRPIAEITAAARRISSERLDERIPVTGTGDELDQLAQTLNDATARLHESFERMRRFSADAAHELRTPLAALRTQIEVTLEREREAAEYRATLAAMQGEVTRLADLVAAMLRLARSEAGLDPARIRLVDLDALLRDVASFFEPVAEEAGVRLVATTLDAGSVEGDAEWLHQLFANLVDNAIRHSAAQGTVRLAARRDADAVVVEVQDTGPGIAVADQARVFERFQRAAEAGTRGRASASVGKDLPPPRLARGRASTSVGEDLPPPGLARGSLRTGGVGLGLSIAREIARAHGGEIALASTPGCGSCFSVRLPAGARDPRRGERTAAPGLRALGVALVLGGTTLGSAGCSDPVALAPPLPGQRLLSFFAVGDTGEPAALAWLRSRQLAVGFTMEVDHRREPVDALLLLGDQFYPDGLHRDTLVAQVSEHVVRPYCGLLRLEGPRSAEVADVCETPAAQRRGVPLHVVLGNHDVKRADGEALQRDAVPALVPDWRLGAGLVERRTLGSGVDLVLLDSERAIDGADLTPLRDAIAEAPGPFRVLAMHRPIANANALARDPDAAEPRLAGRVREAISASGRIVQLVLSGHVHALQVLVEAPPTPLHVVAGGGGGHIRPLPEGDATRRFGLAAPGYSRVDLVHAPDGDRLVASLLRAPSLPIFVNGGGVLVARFSVGVAGDVREEPTTARSAR